MNGLELIKILKQLIMTYMKNLKISFIPILFKVWKKKMKKKNGALL